MKERLNCENIAPKCRRFHASFIRLAVPPRQVCRARERVLVIALSIMQRRLKTITIASSNFANDVIENFITRFVIIRSHSIRGRLSICATGKESGSRLADADTTWSDVRFTEFLLSVETSVARKKSCVR